MPCIVDVGGLHCKVLSQVITDLATAGNETTFNVTPRHGSPLVPRRDPDIEAMLVKFDSSWRSVPHFMFWKFFKSF